MQNKFLFLGRLFCKSNAFLFMIQELMYITYSINYNNSQLFYCLSHISEVFTTCKRYISVMLDYVLPI